jgi:hypothetical protein
MFEDSSKVSPAKAIQMFPDIFEFLGRFPKVAGDFRRRYEDLST